MPTIQFSSQMYEKERASPPTPSITLSHDAVTCGDEVFATFFSSLWHIGDKLFTIATIEGTVKLTFRGQEQVAAGAYSEVRLVGQHLFNGGELLAWVEQEQWYRPVDDSTYDTIVVTDA